MLLWWWVVGGLLLLLSVWSCCDCRPSGLSVLLEVFRMTPLATTSLRDVWNNLHSTWNNASGQTSTSGVCRGGRATESLGQLLDESTADIVCRNVDRISNTEDNERTLSGQGKARLRGIQARS